MIPALPRPLPELKLMHWTKLSLAFFILVLITSCAATVPTENTTAATPNLRAMILPFTLNDLTNKISATIDVVCDNLDFKCTAADGLQLGLQLELPCNLPDTVTSIPFSYNLYPSLTTVDPIPGNSELKRVISATIPEDGDDYKEDELDLNQLISKLARGIYPEEDDDSSSDQLQPKPVTHLIYNSTIQFTLPTDLQPGEHVNIHVVFDNLLDQLSNKALCLIMIDPVEFDTVSIPDDTSTTIIRSHSEFATSHTNAGSIDNDGQFNKLSELGSVLTRTQDTTGDIYTFSINGFIDDILSGYLVSPLLPNELGFTLVPTGTLQTTLLDAGYVPSQCFLFNTKIGPQDITTTIDPVTNLTHFTLRLPKSGTHPDGHHQPASPFAEGHIISDQVQFRCDFSLTVPFAKENGQMVTNGPIPPQVYAPFARANDWGFTVVFQQPICKGLPGLFNFGCVVFVPFLPVADRVGKRVSFVDLTGDVDISNQVDLAKFFNKSKLHYYHNIPTTITLPSTNDIFDDMMSEYQKDDKKNTVMTTVYRSHLTFTSPLPSSLLTNDTFLTPGQLQYTLHLNTHSNEVYQDAGYVVSCVDTKSNPTPQTPSVILTGAFFDAKSGHYTISPHPSTTNHTSYHINADIETEILHKFLPQTPTETFECTIVISITLEDRSGFLRRTYPYPTLIMTTAQEFRSKTSQDVLKPVTFIFEAPLPFYDDFATPYANVVGNKIAIDTNQSKAQDPKQVSAVSQSYSFTFQVTNIDSYNPITTMIVDLLANGWQFVFTENAPFKCIADYDSHDGTKSTAMDDVTVVNVQKIIFSNLLFPANDLISVECPGLQIAKVEGDHQPSRPTEPSKTPLLGITTQSQRYAGYMLGPDVVAEKLNPKTQKLIKLIFTIGTPLLIGMLLTFIIISCCCDCSKKTQ